MASNEFNPIKSVNGKEIPVPSSYTYKLEDVTASDAGRTEDTKMYKKRFGQTVGLGLAWQNISTDDVSAILKAFNPEYIVVTYLDAMQGAPVTSEFYVGNKTAPIYNANLGLWSNVSFDIIERSGT